jgi:hypothetical protein
MENFTDPDNDKYELSYESEKYGFAWNALYGNGFNALMGMYGANWSNIRGESGEAELSAVSDGFRQFLVFIDTMGERGYMYNSWLAASDYYNNLLGYWNDDIRDIFGGGNVWRGGKYYGLLNRYKGMKLLIAPPEIGPSGRQGADPGVSSGDVSATQYFMVSAKVSDE